MRLELFGKSFPGENHQKFQSLFRNNPSKVPVKPWGRLADFQGKALNRQQTEKLSADSEAFADGVAFCYSLMKDMM